MMFVVLGGTSVARCLWWWVGRMWPMFVVLGGTSYTRHQCRNLHHVYMRRKRNRPRFGFVPVLCKRGLSLSLSTPAKLKIFPTTAEIEPTSSVA